MTAHEVVPTVERGPAPTDRRPIHARAPALRRRPAHLRPVVLHPAGTNRLKATVDKAVALLLVVVLAPVLLAVSCAIAVTTGGPVLYRQRRAGWRGETFCLLKFRTMVDGASRRQRALDDCNEADGLLFKMHDDPRVTRLGRVLRRTSIDELPQLWNVLRGEMSLVGPRPLPVRPEAFVGEERRRLEVRPGLTGLWQVSGRSELSWDESIELDLRYVDGWSHGLDLAILARTPLAVARGRGAF
jgi:lipopolysaccharide/colanic/teichoic acid biosynthesis glycosyltransferase